jgi:hypothetical protein
MKVTKHGDTLYEEHGATLKHKCGKRIVALPLLSFSLIFFSFFLFFSFFRTISWIPSPLFQGLIILHHSLPHWDNALIMMIITLQFTYNSIKTKCYDYVWMHLAVYQDVQWSSMTCITIVNGGCATNIMSALYDHAKQYDDEHTSLVDSNGGSCMAIYLGMAKEMPW